MSKGLCNINAGDCNVCKRMCFFILLLDIDCEYICMMHMRNGTLMYLFCFSIFLLTKYRLNN